MNSLLHSDYDNDVFAHNFQALNAHSLKNFIVTMLFGFFGKYLCFVAAYLCYSLIYTNNYYLCSAFGLHWLRSCTNVPLLIIWLRLMDASEKLPYFVY